MLYTSILILSFDDFNLFWTKTWSICFQEHAKGGKCIVFTQTKRDADRLAYAMQRNFKCEALHGDISQNQRERTLAAFRDGRFSTLVATDVAARGLDVPNVDLVILLAFCSFACCPTAWQNIEWIAYRVCSSYIYKEIITNHLAIYRYYWFPIHLGLLW